jgi:anti-anti-sigma factor
MGESHLPDVLQIEAHYDATRATLTLVGEFDMTGTEVFWAHVREAIETHPGSIIINARGLEFIDSSGLQALIRARDAVEAGIRFRVTDPSPRLQRIVDLTGVSDLLLDG